MLRILCAIAVLVAAVGVAVYIHGQEKREAVKERVLEAKVVETEIVASDNGGTPWNFQQLPVVSPMDAAAATRMDRPFRYPSSFTKGWRIFDLDVGDLKKMYGSRPAGIGFGALIDQFEGDFFEGTFADVLPSPSPSKKSMDFKGLHGIVDGVPKGNKTYFVYTFDIDEWDDLRTKYLKLPDELLDDELLESCMEDRAHLDSFVQTVYWHQLFLGTEGSGMKFHKDAFRTQLWSLQMRGKKTYLFCRPDATNQKKFPMEGFVRNDKYEAVVEGLGLREKCFEATLGPGDLIFWPSTWWHETRVHSKWSVNVMSAFLQDHHVGSFKPVTWPSRSDRQRLGSAILATEQRCHVKWREAAQLARSRR